MAKKEKINRRVEFRLRDRSEMTGCHKCGAQEIVADIIIQDTRVFPPEEELRPLCDRCYDIYWRDLERLADEGNALTDSPRTKPEGSVKNHAEIILTPITDPNEIEMLDKIRAEKRAADDVKTRRQSSRGNRACRGSSGGRAAD
jgi:hypothetical protein